MDNYYYILKDKTPIECDKEEFIKSLNFGYRQIQLTTIGDYEISTVFLGINHQYKKGYPPLLFETAIFHLKAEKEVEIYNRYSTYQDAEIGHELAVRGIKYKKAIEKSE